jgi:hypothetical protein
MTDDTRGRKRRAPWLTRLLDRIDERVSASIDDDAFRRGWTVRRLPGTRTHVYRDPRWNRRRACESCAGSGLDAMDPCETCDGVGVVTVIPAGVS